MLDGRFPTFRLLQETVVGFMRERGLIWESVEDGTMLLKAVKAKMEHSSAMYRFASCADLIRGHEGLGLTLLEHRNRGHLYNNQAALRPASTLRESFGLYYSRIAL